MNFNFLEVTDSNLLKKVFEFRYEIFLEIYPEYLQSLKLGSKEEQDKYDRYAIHYAALDENNEICATVRLIYNSPFGYPTENYMKVDNDNFERDKLGEISRIFIDPKYRRISTSKVIIYNFIEMIYEKMLLLGIEYTYGSLESNFLRLLRIYKFNYITIGDEQVHKYFGLRYPCILHTDQITLKNKSLKKQ